MTSPASQRILAVLVVDDDPDMQRWAAAILQRGGCRISAAADAMVGLMLVRSFNPDVIVLDLGLPAGGGKGFLERLRKMPTFQQVPVLILSGKVTPQTAGELKPFGVSAILQKPVQARVFLDAVRRASSPGASSSSPS